MNNERQFVFAPFTFDPSSDCLLRGSTKILLRPKSSALLHYSLEHPVRLVTKVELIDALWAKTNVVDSVLKVSITEIRKALDDRIGRPEFIETVGRKGYRFIAPVTVTIVGKDARDSTVYVVGGHTDLDRLHDCLDSARSGKRQLIFVTGEPGIGKTTLVDAFIKFLPASYEIVAAYGQCIEQYGASEAYLPVLDAIERLCSGEAGRSRIEALRRYAPSWLVNLPAVTSGEERIELLRETAGGTPERRMREIGTFLDDISEKQTVLLIFEDVHWLDPSTLTVISFLARKREPSRLMLIATY